MEARFADRIEAARMLARRLVRLHGRRPVIVGLGRDAVPMAVEIAAELGGEPDVLLLHEIRHPAEPGRAIAAVDEEGRVLRYGGAELPEAQLLALAEAGRSRLAARRRAFSRVRPGIELRGRIVAVVDDGQSANDALLAAVASVRQRGAARVIAVVPVVSVEALRALEERADEVAALFVPGRPAAAREFYQRLEAIGDEAALASLASPRAPEVEGVALG